MDEFGTFVGVPLIADSDGEEHRQGKLYSFLIHIVIYFFVLVAIGSYTIYEDIGSPKFEKHASKEYLWLFMGGCTHPLVLDNVGYVCLGVAFAGLAVIMLVIICIKVCLS